MDNCREITAFLNQCLACSFKHQASFSMDDFLGFNKCDNHVHNQRGIDILGALEWECEGVHWLLAKKTMTWGAKEECETIVVSCYNKQDVIVFKSCTPFIMKTLFRKVWDYEHKVDSYQMANCYIHYTNSSYWKGWRKRFKIINILLGHNEGKW